MCYALSITAQLNNCNIIITNKYYKYTAEKRKCSKGTYTMESLIERLPASFLFGLTLETLFFTCQAHSNCFLFLTSSFLDLEKKRSELNLLQVESFYFFFLIEAMGDRRRNSRRGERNFRIESGAFVALIGKN